MRRQWALLVGMASVLIASALLKPASGQDGRFFSHKRDDAPTLAQVARMIDHIESCILNQGTVVIKQPDIWSQNRMTMFRKEFEDTMRGELGNFHTYLNARIARSDVAALQSQTLLGASLSPTDPSKNFILDPADVRKERDMTVGMLNGSFTSPASGTTAALPTLPSPIASSGGGFPAPIQQFQLLNSATPMGNLTYDTTKGQLAASALNFGLEPNVTLDQRADYITHLHRLRRVNLGDDNTDSAGYGLYLMRIPVSIQPGDHTVKGHGAVVTVTMRHDFAPKFLYTTYRNLVINDVIDKLAPPVHELIRSGGSYRFGNEIGVLNQRIRLLGIKIESIKNHLDPLVKEDPQGIGALVKTLTAPPLLTTSMADLRDSSRTVEYGAEELLLNLDKILTAVQSYESTRSEQAQNAAKQAITVAGTRSLKNAGHWEALVKAGTIRRAQYSLSEAIDTPSDPQKVESAISQLKKSGIPLSDAATNKINRAVQQANTARDVEKTLVKDRAEIELLLRQTRPEVRSIQQTLHALTPNIKAATNALPITRSGTRVNAIAPSDVQGVFVKDNLYRLAWEAQQALDLGNSPPDSKKSQKVRMNDVRSYLRHELESAYDIMAFRRNQDQPPLMDVLYIESIVDLVANRNFEQPAFDDADGAKPEDNDLEQMYGAFVQRLPGNLKNKPLGPLCWAIAIEAGLLNRFLRDDIIQTKGNNDYAPPPNLDALFFYTPQPDEETERAFEEYVKARWPMITFALEPVVDQQNIEDAFTRRRDLQLAVAFALASGRISFRQAMTYNRQLQYEAQTIALNQTVSSFAYGNDTFGWRFTPRYQTPPEESNPRAIANLLWRGGPGPNYQIKNSKIEPGMRELTAVVVMPSFVKGMRIDASSDWFKLADPDDRKINTAKTVELGRKINEAKQCLEAACTCGLYRTEDIERLRVRLHQLEQMLPMQTSFVRVPFENTVGGFALFTQGASALVPELSGYEGIEYLDTTKPADIIVYGKHFSIYESAVVVGGMALPREGQHAYRVDVGADKKQTIVGVTLTPFRDKDGNLVYVDQAGNVRDLGDNGSYDILSREVLRVRIPAGVKTAKREDGQEIVELYVASPNGISNRLQIPVVPKAEPPKFGVAKGSGMAFIDGDALVQVEANISGTGATATLAPQRLRPVSPETRVRIQPIGPTTPQYEAVNLLLNFSVAFGPNNGAVTIPVVVTSVARDADTGFYTISPAQIDQIASELYQRIRKENPLTLPPVVEAVSAFATPVPLPDSKDEPPTSKMTNKFKITFETVLVPGTTAANAMNAGAPDRAIARAEFEPNAPVAASPLVAPTLPLVEPQPAGEVLRTGYNNSQRVPARNAAYQQIPTLPQGDNSTAQALNNAASALAASAAAQANSNASNLANQAHNALPQTPSQASQSLVVVPQTSPRINVNVPVVNTSKHKLFHRDDKTPASAPRRSILNRIMNGP